MNPQYPQGHMAPPGGQQIRPPGPNMYNGPPQPGQYGGSVPPKPGMPPSQFGGTSVQNGPHMGGFPTQGGGPQGDTQYGSPRPPMPPGPNKPPQMPGQMQRPPGPPTSFAGPGSGPPTSFAGPGSGPPTSFAGGPPTSFAGPGSGPPTSFAGPGSGPPTSFAGPGSGPPTSFAGPGARPQTSYPGPGGGYQPRPGAPPMSQGQTQQLSNHMSAMNLSGPPMGPGQGQSRMSGPPSSMGMTGPPPQVNSSTAPPSSMQQHSGFPPPPSSMSGPPSSQAGPGMRPSPGMVPPSGMGMPQNRFGGAPTPPQSGMGVPPTSMPMSGMTPPSGYGSQSGYPGGQALPPSGPGMPPMPPSTGGPGSLSPSMLPPQPGQMSNQPGQMPSQPGQFPPTNQYMGGSLPGQGFPNQPYPGQPQMGAPGSMQQPAPKKLDPDQMPSPIQVIEDDRANRSGIFQTNAKGLVPPLVTTKFTVQDQGNCNPRFMRSTMYNVPCTSDMLKNSYIPFALNICPFAKLAEHEQEPPMVDLGEIGPVRCKRCKAYMSPFMQFIDGGRRFQCVFCGAATDVPAEYFQHLDHTGRRVDCYDRPELCLGSYEFVATKDYCKNGVIPKSPAFIFMIDVSYNSVKSGLTSLICERLKDEVLVNLPKEEGSDEIRVGFATYAKEIHFYNVKGNLAQPQMLVVSDLEDVFVPLLDGFLVTLSESEAVIDSLLSQIPQMFAESRETETILGPVIQAGLDALKAADRSGKLYIFHTSLPIAEAPGKLKNRDDRKLLGTEKEKTILTPQNNFYTNLGKECVTAGCSVDIFLFPNSYVDVASISEVCRLTGGNMYKYSYFQADLDGERFIEDLKRNVQNQKAFDTILRLRASTGIRAVDFYGNFYMGNTTDVELAAVDRHQALNVEIKHDDKLSESEGAYIQVAALYTSVSGQRRLRIHNLSLNCCTQMADLFRNCELDTLVNFMSKQAIRTALNTNPKQVREAVMNQVSQILACYRKNCASPSSAGQLILPECMKLLPVYANCIIKSDGLQGGQEISTDDRSYLMHLINSMDVTASHVFFYPRLIPVHDLDDHVKPKAMRCSADRLQEDGVYLLENGISMFMWIGHNVDPHWIQQIFGVQSAAQVDIDKCTLLDLDNTLSQRLRDIITSIREGRHRYMKLTVVRQRDKLEPWFNHFLVEDKGLNGSASYVDFLCHIHKEIRNLLS